MKTPGQGIGSRWGATPSGPSACCSSPTSHLSPKAQEPETSNTSSETRNPKLENRKDRTPQPEAREARNPKPETRTPHTGYWFALGRYAIGAFRLLLIAHWEMVLGYSPHRCLLADPCRAVQL